MMLSKEQNEARSSILPPRKFNKITKALKTATIFDIFVSPITGQRYMEFNSKPKTSIIPLSEEELKDILKRKDIQKLKRIKK